jgi:hypothetical protein
MLRNSFPIISIVCGALTFASAQAGLAQQVTEPLGGQPAAGSKPSVPDLGYQVKYQRAFEAVVWSIPAVAIYRFRAAAFSDIGLKDKSPSARTAPISGFTPSGLGASDATNQYDPFLGLTWINCRCERVDGR